MWRGVVRVARSAHSASAAISLLRCHAPIPTIAAVNERPVGVADAEVVSALREHWGLAVTRLEYLPVGYGGYHWAATGPGGQRMFVTLSDVTGDDAFSDLAATMNAAASLANIPHMSFVVGPVPTVSGHAAARLGLDWAIIVTPFADGDPGRWGDELGARDLAKVASMLASLHGCPAPIGIPVRRPDLAGRDVIEILLGERAGSRANIGPYAEPARELVVRHATGLWWVLPDPDTEPDGYADLGNLYTQLSGRAVDVAAIALRAPHERTADTQVAWAGLDDAVRRVAEATAGWNRRPEPL
jgi:hypothetical protein